MAEAMKRPIGACPDPETIAAYFDGRMHGRERARLTEHLAGCDDCGFVFSEAAPTRIAATARGERRPWRAVIARPFVLWPAVGAGLAAAAALWLVVGTGALGRWRSAQPPELQALVAAVGTDRLFEPRLTGGFAYGPVRGAVRGDAGVPPASPDVRIAAAEIEKDAGTSRTQQAMRLLGVAHLVVGDVDRAVATLETAANEATADATTFSDLSAAYLVRAAGSRQASDAAAGLAMAERAIQANPRLAEAWFNRACAFEQASRAAEARQAWQDYLKVDSQSGWADEARTHLAALERR